MSEKTEKQSGKKIWIYSIAGIATEVILSVILMVAIMPSMMAYEKNMLEGILL